MFLHYPSPSSKGLGSGTEASVLAVAVATNDLILVLWSSSERYSSARDGLAQMPPEPAQQLLPGILGCCFVMRGMLVVHEGMAGWIDDRFEGLILLSQQVDDVLALAGRDAGIRRALDDQRRRGNPADILGGRLVGDGVERGDGRQLRTCPLGRAPGQEAPHAEAGQTKLLGLHLAPAAEIADRLDNLSTLELDGKAQPTRRVTAWKWSERYGRSRAYGKPGACGSLGARGDSLESVAARASGYTADPHQGGPQPGDPLGTSCKEKIIDPAEAKWYELQPGRSQKIYD